MKPIRIWLIILGLSVFVLSATSCDKLALFGPKPQAPQQPAEDQKVQGTLLAKINSAVITLEDFNTRVDNFNQLSQKEKIDTLDRKKAFLQSLIQQEVLYQHAASLGLDKDPLVKKAVEEFRKGLTIQKLLSDELSAVNVESKEIENFYNLTKNNYRVADEIKASEIVVASQDSARQVLIEVLKGEVPFASLAQQYSKASSARNGGNLGWLKRGDRKIERFDEVVFTLKKGEVSNVFETPEGYLIVKVDDKRGGELKPISAVWDQVKQELLNFKQNQTIMELERSLRSKSNIEIHEELLR